jgi:hypothetical protein
MGKNGLDGFPVGMQVGHDRDLGHLAFIGIRGGSTHVASTG